MNSEIYKQIYAYLFNWKLGTGTCNIYIIVTSTPKKQALLSLASTLIHCVSNIAVYVFVSQEIKLPHHDKVVAC